MKAFWLAGHSQGGMTSNRIVCTDYFKDKVDGWLSLSGGRLGANPGRGNFAALSAAGGRGRRHAGAGARRRPAAATTATDSPRPISRSSTKPASARWTRRDCRKAPTWAAKNRLRRAARADEIADLKAGYVYDGAGRIRPSRPGAFCRRPARRTCSRPDCKDGRVVADVVRLDKGHTEGLEPQSPRSS